MIEQKQFSGPGSIVGELVPSGELGFLGLDMFLPFKLLFAGIFKKRITSEQMAAMWRAKCSNPKTHDPKECGPDLYDPRRINCPAGSSAETYSEVGVPINRCVCNLGVMSKAEALRIGCDLSAVWRYAPLAMVGAGLYFVLKSSKEE